MAVKYTKQKTFGFSWDDHTGLFSIRIINEEMHFTRETFIGAVNRFLMGLNGEFDEIKKGVVKRYCQDMLNIEK